MTGFRLIPLALLATLGSNSFASAVAAQAQIAKPQVKYFRSDFGVTGAAAGSLPDDLDQLGALHWRVPLDPGQSSPTVYNGAVFLTTYRREANELATVALDSRSGAVLWKQIAPVTNIEVFHPQMGSAAVATPACDGSRLYAFFGSYGLICYDLHGKTLWEHTMGPFRDEYGAGSSPMHSRAGSLRGYGVHGFLGARGRPGQSLDAPFLAGCPGQVGQEQRWTPLAK